MAVPGEWYANYYFHSELKKILYFFICNSFDNQKSDTCRVILINLAQE